MKWVCKIGYGVYNESFRLMWSLFLNMGCYVVVQWKYFGSLCEDLQEDLWTLSWRFSSIGFCDLRWVGHVAKWNELYKTEVCFYISSSYLDTWSLVHYCLIWKGFSFHFYPVSMTHTPCQAECDNGGNYTIEATALWSDFRFTPEHH